MIIYLHTQFHMHIFNGSIIITIKPNATHTFYMAAISIYIYPETALNKCCIFFLNIHKYIKFSYFVVSVPVAAP